MIVRRILTRKADAARELDRFIDADILICMRSRSNWRPTGIHIGKVVRPRLEIPRSEVKINGVRINIFRSEPRGVDAPFFELANKCICNVALAVIHAIRFD